MSHGIKLFPTRTGVANFVASNEDWTAEAGAAIFSTGSSITNQDELHITTATTLAGAVSPLVTLVGSMLPVRATCLYKTDSAAQGVNISILDQAGTVLASTNQASSAFSTTYNDYKRGTVDVTVPADVTGVQMRVCRADATSGTILLDEAAMMENVLLVDPDSIRRQPSAQRITHATLSGRRVTDVQHRHYSFDYSWGVVEAPTYDRLQEFLYRNEALWLDDGDVPDNQEVFPVYVKGRQNHTNLRSLYVSNPGGGTEFYAQTIDDSLLPNDSGWGTDITTWADAAYTNLGSTNGASLVTSDDSMYGYALFHFPTWGNSIGQFDNAMTLAVDVVSEVNSTSAGNHGFDVWLNDTTSGYWRRVQSVVRTGESNFVLDLRSTDLLSAVVDTQDISKAVEFLFRTRATDYGPGAKLTFKNLQFLGNAGLDWPDVAADDMGNYGAHVVDFVQDPKAIDYVLLDSRGTTNERAVTTLTAGTDYINRPSGVALATESANADQLYQNNGQMLVHYSREFLVQMDSLPDTWLRTGATSSHSRQLSLALSTLRSSVREDLVT